MSPDGDVVRRECDHTVAEFLLMQCVCCEIIRSICTIEEGFIIQVTMQSVSKSSLRFRFLNGDIENE